LWRLVKTILEKQGGIPKGKHHANVHLVLNKKGGIVSCRIVDPSGNEKIDQALKVAMTSFRVSDPPPEGMPGGMTIKVSSQG
jgi:TonB family protein